MICSKKHIDVIKNEGDMATQKFKISDFEISSSSKIHTAGSIGFCHEKRN